MEPSGRKLTVELPLGTGRPTLKFDMVIPPGASFTEGGRAELTYPETHDLVALGLPIVGIIVHVLEFLPGSHSPVRRRLLLRQTRGVYGTIYERRDTDLEQCRKFLQGHPYVSNLS